ncbi:hypothetical protein CYY_005514 [Polysphondylium violaceum]|uniref:Uncharacterized protein n=1 Tax=Polysphondylium violaceum TaxID=133409 RepID=A0A8J4PTM9_9MYCE|nr:hypothetical protein CYY_005514 [Polysphondylium violaceum]
MDHSNTDTESQQSNDGFLIATSSAEDAGNNNNDNNDSNLQQTNTYSVKKEKETSNSNSNSGSNDGNSSIDHNVNDINTHIAMTLSSMKYENNSNNNIKIEQQQKDDDNNSNNDNIDIIKNNLLVLNDIKDKEKDYNQIKDCVLKQMDLIDKENNMIDELHMERSQLIQEFKKYELLMKEIQIDLSRVDNVLAVSKKEKEKIQADLQQLQDMQLYPLKDSIDSQRKSIGLPTLPSIQEEKDRLNAEYLRDRLDKHILQQQQQQQLQSSFQSQSHTYTGAKRGRKRSIHTG